MNDVTLPNIKLIAAVGRNGELGLNGRLPWGDLFPEDRKRFREATRGGVVLVGRRTWPSVRHLQFTAQRLFIVDEDGMAPLDLLDAYGVRSERVWIAGGAKTYLRWMPLVSERLITVLEWEGPADTWMPAAVWQPSVAEAA